MTGAVQHLPHATDGLAGLRAARWVRKSTAGQYDNWGPDAQQELQNRVILRHDLVDTGLAWQSAASGRTVHLRPLLVGYVSRFQRNLKQTLIAVDDLHAAGVAVLFCDEARPSRTRRPSLLLSTRSGTHPMHVTVYIAGSRMPDRRLSAS